MTRGLRDKNDQYYRTCKSLNTTSCSYDGCLSVLCTRHPWSKLRLIAKVKAKKAMRQLLISLVFVKESKWGRDTHCLEHPSWCCAQFMQVLPCLLY